MQNFVKALAAMTILAGCVVSHPRRTTTHEPPPWAKRQTPKPPQIDFHWKDPNSLDPKIPPPRPREPAPAPAGPKLPADQIDFILPDNHKLGWYSV